MNYSRPRKTALSAAIAVALGVSLAAPVVHAQIEEVIVTATKREASTQDIPVAVTALGESALEELDIDVFTDYLLQLPGVSASSIGPGQGTIYIRGIASTPPLLTTAGAAGLAPNVALYLDEQPVTQVGRNLDVYAADLNRVEVLPGPQGTLFGASSQAGTIRLITNKPVMDEFFATFNAGLSFTAGGDMSNKVEAIVNVPVNEKFAVRGVFYNDNQGGYIDNVAGTITLEESARFRSANFVRPNGTVVGAGQAGFQAGADLSAVTFVEESNLELVEKNFNDASYSGFRIGGTYEFNDEWSLNVTHTRQQIDAEGVFFADPTLDSDLTKIQRYAGDVTDDEFDNTSWTIEGTVGGLEAVYTGAFLNRDVNQVVDYTDYLFVGQYLPYYLCDGSVSYPGGAPSGTCQSPLQFVVSRTQVEVQTHELRFSTPQENRVRATFGGFVSTQDLIEQNNFTYPGSQLAESFTPGVFGFSINSPLDDSSVTNPDPRPRGVIFFNDLTRTDDQLGLFAEVSFDLVPDAFSVTVGARYHDVSVDMVGSANSSFFNFGLPDGQDSQAFGANLDQIFDGNDINERTGESFGGVIPDDAEAEGTVVKGTLSWTPSDSSLIYFTYSEGFRPGLPNRPALSGGGAVPAVVRTDEVTNFELGWKASFLDNTLQINGSAFFVDIEDLQTTIFDPNVTNLLFSDNAADAEVSGVEADFIWVPIGVEGLTVTGAISILDTEIKELVGASIAIAGPGEELAYAPKFQGNVRGRYVWEMTEKYDAHWQIQFTHSESSFSDIVSINRAEQGSYDLFNASFGIDAGRWRAEVFGDNLGDERAELNNNLNYDRERIAINRPRTWGIRFSADFE